jgi:hypothetical protein
MYFAGLAHENGIVIPQAFFFGRKFSGVFGVFQNLRRKYTARSEYARRREYANA